MGIGGKSDRQVIHAAGDQETEHISLGCPAQDHSGAGHFWHPLERAQQVHTWDLENLGCSAVVSQVRYGSFN